MASITISDIYARVHKGLRKALFELAYVAGRTDFTNAEALVRLKEQAREAIHFLRRHGYVEDTFQLPTLEARAPGATDHATEEHHRIEREIEEIEMALEKLTRIVSREERRTAGEEFYLRLNSFISDYLRHMRHEEEMIAPLYLKHCTDEDLRGMMTSILANSPPADSLLMFRYTIPAIDPTERAAFLGKVKSAAPPQAFENAMKVIQGVLSEEEFTTLQTALA
jgi:iron-sulfur cluster repair protein YtfE (RIC family)